MNPADEAFVDVAFEMLAAQRFDFKSFESAVFEDADPTLFGVGDVDDHDF
jgi:hypothetical protein